MGYKAMLFDLDDTLIDRDKAVDNLFLLVLENVMRMLVIQSKQYVTEIQRIR